MYCTVPSAGEGAVWVEGGRGEGVNLMEEKRKWGTPPGEKAQQVSKALAPKPLSQQAPQRRSFKFDESWHGLRERKRSCDVSPSWGEREIHLYKSKYTQIYPNLSVNQVLKCVSKRMKCMMLL